MRIGKHDWAMQMAASTSQRSTCCRRNVGCVLLDIDGHVLSTGYNGVAAGMPHCNDVDNTGMLPNACSGATSASGTNLDSCEAIHAEQNALLQCKAVSKIYSCYVSCSPCITCTKLLLNTTCVNIYFESKYPDNKSEELWLRAGRNWSQLPN